MDKKILLLMLLGWLCCMPDVAAQTTDRYAAHSVLSQGRWVKIRIPETGLYQITDSLARQAGFADAAHVSVWGYGGALQPEVLTPDYLKETDDLKPVATYYDGRGRRLFHGVGPVNWPTRGKESHVRNYYSDYGYYFLTDATEDATDEPLDSAGFMSKFYPSPNDFHSLHEIDDYAWYHSGRHLFEKSLFGEGVSRTFELPAYSNSGSMTISMTFKKQFTARLKVNGLEVATLSPGAEVVSQLTGKLTDAYAKAGRETWQIDLGNILQPNNIVEIVQETGSSLRLDFIAINSASPRPLDSANLPVPEMVGAVSSQDRHADEWADMVIIIPASRKLQAQAERLKRLHEEHDGLRVNLVAADELYNEFSSGTPDGNAYRRYLKMLYDRAATPEERPRYLLLFGDGAWDNRLKLTGWNNASTDDLLLCYESDNSVSETKSYVSDDYFALLDDGEGDNLLRTDLTDVGVGRFPVATVEAAKVMVDKVAMYYENAHAGAWQNLLCFMGDDGNQNMHMNDAEVVSAMVERDYKGYNIQKIYWDAYPRVTSIIGDRYPEVERDVKQNMQNGALVMNYTGHGGVRSLSHENVLSLSDFETITTKNLPLWVTASCDIMAFDTFDKTLGEAAVLAPNGGAIGFVGTTRTVYAFYNQCMNRYFMHYVLGTTNGRRNTLGDAMRLTKNYLIKNREDLTENKLHYHLLGDPAVMLAAPTLDISIDSINGQSAYGESVVLGAGARVRVTGCIPGRDDFEGTVSVTVFDAEQTITGRQNSKTEADTAIVYKDFTNVVYQGTNRMTGGRLDFSFTVSRDISYSDILAKMVVFAVTDDGQQAAHGENRNFYFGSGGEVAPDEEGPQMVCYLDDSDFVDGGEVYQNAMFVAELYDESGINTSGSGIGHDLELVIDNKTAYTFYLNNLFENLDGDNRKGIVRYQLPRLSYGAHSLRFRAWDMLNNSSKVTLNFRVVDPMGIETAQTDDGEQGDPQLFDAAGRRVDGKSSASGGLYICRSADGSVKKIMRKRQ